MGFKAHLDRRPFNKKFHEVEFKDSLKALFLPITLPERWDILCTAISNLAPASGLTSANVESSLLTEEVNKKNLDNTCSSTALVVNGRSKEKKKEESQGVSLVVAM